MEKDTEPTSALTPPSMPLQAVGTETHNEKKKQTKKQHQSGSQQPKNALFWYYTSNKTVKCPQNNLIIFSFSIINLNGQFK